MCVVSNVSLNKYTYVWPQPSKLSSLTAIIDQRWHAAIARTILFELFGDSGFKLSIGRD